MDNCTPRQDLLLRRLEATAISTSDPPPTPALARVRWDALRGAAADIRGQLGRIAVADHADSRAFQAEQVMQRFLSEYAELFGLTSAAAQLRPVQRRTDDRGWTHLEYQQQHLADPETNAEPLDVYGAKLAAHIAPDGTLTQVQSSCWRDVESPAAARQSAEDVRAVLAAAAADAPAYVALERQAAERGTTRFPLLTPPRLVVYPWQGRFRLAWSAYAYGIPDRRADDVPSRLRLTQGHAFIDAVTGEIFVFASLARHAETPALGSGFGVTPLGGPFLTRPLNVIFDDERAVFALRDTTHARPIETYDAGNLEQFANELARLDGLASGSLPLSTNDSASWERLPADGSDAERTASQQPEVDCHHFVREAYEWYDALTDGRKGWDDDRYPSLPGAPLPIRAITHTSNGAAASPNNAEQRLEYDFDGNAVGWLAFFDGDGDEFGYLAGSKFIVGHEYQHAITDFSVSNGGLPGIDYQQWFAAAHEGISDAFGAFFADQWLTAGELLSNETCLRNLVFPRDGRLFAPHFTRDSRKLDHYRDRPACSTSTPEQIKNDAYKYGAILAHCAFLMGAGGVHQRASRQPGSVPVAGLGYEWRNGLRIPIAALIWYQALSDYGNTLGADSGDLCADERVFFRIRDACVSAAADLFCEDSRQHATTRLAFYAVGLEPEVYGADVAFLPWGASWRASRSYVSVMSDDYASRDLVVANGGGSEWNALINVVDSSGQATQFENSVACRVRNLGDMDAEAVRVDFFYAPLSTSPLSWAPMVDRDGIPQALTVGSLAAGQLTFSDDDQSAPPAGATVRWAIPPLATGEEVDRFCLRATVSAANDVNAYNNDVETRVAYVPYVPDGSVTVAFRAGNPTPGTIPLDVRIGTQLPSGWLASIDENLSGVTLATGEERLLHCTIAMQSGDDASLQPPLDGFVTGEGGGKAIRGSLTRTTRDGAKLAGLLAARFDDGALLTGDFTDNALSDTGELAATCRGNRQLTSGGPGGYESIALDLCLRPLRAITIEQWVADEPLGGITIRVQVAAPSGSPCHVALPPTETRFTP